MENLAIPYSLFHQCCSYRPEALGLCFNKPHCNFFSSDSKSVTAAISYFQSSQAWQTFLFDICIQVIISTNFLDKARFLSICICLLQSQLVLFLHTISFTMSVIEWILRWKIAKIHNQFNFHIWQANLVNEIPYIPFSGCCRFLKTRRHTDQTLYPKPVPT